MLRRILRQLRLSVWLHHTHGHFWKEKKTSFVFTATIRKGIQVIAKVKDAHRLLNLPLLYTNLLLQFLYHLLQTVKHLLVLFDLQSLPLTIFNNHMAGVLVHLKLELPSSSFLFCHSLDCFLMATSFWLVLVFNHSHPFFDFSQGFLPNCNRLGDLLAFKIANHTNSTLEHGSFWVFDFSLKFLEWEFEPLPVTVDMGGVFLFLSDLLGETIGVGSSLEMLETSWRDYIYPCPVLTLSTLRARSSDAFSSLRHSSSSFLNGWLSHESLPIFPLQMALPFERKSEEKWKLTLAIWTSLSTFRFIADRAELFEISSVFCDFRSAWSNSSCFLV